MGMRWVRGVQAGYKGYMVAREVGTRGMRWVQGVQGGYKGYKVGTRGTRWV